METQLRLLEIPEGVKVDVVTPFLEDKARKWWEAISPAISRADYVAVIPGCFLEANKGLNSQIQSALVVYQATTFVDLMGAAIRAETDIKRREDENKNKRPLSVSTNQSGQKFKRPNQSSDPTKGFIPTDASIKLCPICNFRHPGECRRTSGACFNCGKMGHRIADFPKPKKVGMGSSVGATPGKPKENKPNSRVFAITQEEADDARDVMEGTIMINQFPSYVLFDCGATHSFISKRFSKKLRIEPEMLVEPYIVATPTSKTIETHKVHRNCNICINRYTFEASLIQLNMVEFDEILGMDWLAKNHALVDCKEKNMKLRVPNKNDVVFQGKDKGPKSLLSTSQAWKFMKNGEEIYLAMISEVKEKGELKLEDISVVQEFPNVFPGELPGTVLDREVEFETNLVPDDVTISKAPY
ncbi:uncharacterized protein [Henckelia pumila]|uniref:uncharacterized protein n=1 Tax=Henckelia pumila TaxID=405737 RepID=UPI003C6E36B3